MKKQFNTAAVINELKGASIFFPGKKENGEVKGKSLTAPLVDKTHQRNEATQPTQAGKLARSLAREQDSLLEEIRRALKPQGKEVSYVRLTQAEKDQLADIIYSYKRQGIRTTETEIGRIALNFLMEDYKQHGKASVLARLLEILHA